MERLPTPLLLAVNRYGYLSLLLLPALILVLLFGIEGYTTFELIVALAIGIAVVSFWWLTHARQTPNVPNSTPRFLDLIRQRQQYTVLALESELCLSSTQVGKQLEALEKAYPERFQLYALSIFQEPGREMYKEFEGRFTPTYVLLNPKGEVLMNFPLVLPVERVIYAVENQARRV